MGKISFFVCLVFLASSLFVHVSLANTENVEGKQGKGEIKTYVLKKGDITVKLSNWGATIVSVHVPDKQGKMADIVLGYDDLNQYKKDKVYFGALVGRVANRIGGAKFSLNGTTYKLVNNEGKNLLHGGKTGFGDVFWKASRLVDVGPHSYITFSYNSTDGEQGFPGRLNVEVTYLVYNSKRLTVHMKATALDKPTPVNLAQHAYWNLGGHDSGDILSHEVQLHASHITPTDGELIPTGKIEPVKDTPYDFLTAKTVGSRIDKLPKGYDINYVVDKVKASGRMKKIAMVRDPKSGRVMNLWSNKPGVQFYTGNLLKNVKGKAGAVYGPHAAMCLETQGFPDAVNHPNFPSVIVTPRKPYRHVMTYMFSSE